MTRDWADHTFWAGPVRQILKPANVCRNKDALAMNTNQPGSHEQQSPQKGQPEKHDPQRKPTQDSPPGGSKDRGSSQQQRPGSPGSGSQPKHDQN